MGTKRMKTITYTAARMDLKATMDGVVDDHSPVLITRQAGEAVVMVSAEDWTSMEETNYLLRSPANAARMIEAIDQLDAGAGQERELIPVDE